MKYRMLMNMMVGAGMVTAPLLVTASGFGGGWMHNKGTGTLYYSHAPDHGHQQADAERHQSVRLNGFGGGWVHDPSSRTISYSLVHDRTVPTAAAGNHSSLSKLEGGVEPEPAKGMF